MENNYEKTVVEFLSDGGKKSTSEITSNLTRDYYFVLNLLEEMEKKEIIEKVVVRKFTYWRLKNGK